MKRQRWQQQQQRWRRQRGDVSTGTDHEPADQTQDWSKERIGFELILRKRINSPTIIIVLLLLLLPLLLLLLHSLSRTIDDHVTGPMISTLPLRNALPMWNGPHRSIIIIIITSASRPWIDRWRNARADYVSPSIPSTGTFNS